MPDISASGQCGDGDVCLFFSDRSGIYLSACQVGDEEAIIALVSILIAEMYFVNSGSGGEVDSGDVCYIVFDAAQECALSGGGIGV